MRLVFLGTGTSSGIPAIGCECGVCTSSDPRDNRLRASVALQWTDDRGRDRCVVIDTGPDFRQQAIRHKLKRLDAVLYTHNHVDHTFGLDEVRRYNAIQHEAIDIYAEPHTLEHLFRVYKHIFDREQNVNDSFVATLIPHRIEERDVEQGRAIVLYGASFTPVRALHGKLPVLGYRIESPPGLYEGPDSPFPLAYLTDISALPPESWPRLRGLKTLVIDALRHRRHPTHLTVGQALSISHEVEPARTYLIHMTHDLKHAETEAELPEGVFLSYDGLVLGDAPATRGPQAPAGGPADDV